MSSAMNKIWKKVRIFLRGISWKKILTFSFFIIIAAILWFMQIYNHNFETNVSIPVKYTSVPDSIIFSDTLPSRINIRVRDLGYNMFRYRLKKDDTVFLDVSPVIDNNNNSSKVLQGALLEAYLRKLLPQTATIINYDPVRISFNYNTLQSRKIPIIFDGQLNISPGYFLNGDIRLVPDSVTAYGSLSDLSKLNYVYTSTDTINRLESNRKIIYKLQEINRIKLVPEQIAVYVPVEAYTQKKIEVPIEGFNLPQNLTVKFFPSKVNLSFFVGVSLADSINTNDFSVGVDYESIKDSKSASVPVRITESPSYARNLTIDPPNVEFIFEYKDDTTP